MVSAMALCCSSQMNSRFDSWGDVRVFLSVLDTGSTLAASRKLGMSQPTVARRIDALEHALKLTLFERDTRGFRPTQEALALVEGARSIEAAAVSFRDKAARLGGVNTRPIRLTAPQTNFPTTSRRQLPISPRRTPERASSSWQATTVSISGRARPMSRSGSPPGSTTTA